MFVFLHCWLFSLTFFEVWGVALRQAKRGVPIGGFLSAQLMCLWALIREHTFFSDPAKDNLIRAVRTQWPKQREPVSVKPGPRLTCPSVLKLGHWDLWQASD